ncbi:hypothetical protein P167DRAFT_552875 [Morchella conica CCBAS932]|uniref:C2H2-type domain-containing protein n=1 Tax=Morchella conica CCBAS932 TaxID=1392247 RepID=A0A3N4KT81_9PEZI|nr:hypothetical protein P167DRAFT_552875 [Morchella conica CCBAS932]
MPAPIDITSRPRPHQPKSNLTSQLRAAGEAYAGYTMEPVGARSGSISQNNALAMSSKLRRESMVNGDMARSLMGGGMSWGGVSVGSWIRDDIIMAGTSPFTFGSPSFHSSSYLPKLEADFCRDFSCCGLPLPSLHDLLRHYEEHHAQQSGTVCRDENGPTGSDLPQQQQQQHPRPQQQNAAGMTSPISGMGGIQLGLMQRIQQRQQEEHDAKEEDEEQDGEVAGDMEMDDDDMTPPPAPLTPQNHNQHTSYPPTPTTHSQPSYQSTPNLVHAQPSGLGQKPSHFSPESSVPGTPHAMDQHEYGFPQNNTVQGNQQNLHIPTTDYYELATGNIELCINEPAKTLFSPGGVAMGGYTSQYQHMISAANGNILPQEDKPFKCPVIGCEKAYKNQNGLKYHKAHGHANQQLHDNADGTFSILNPETSTPYPGTVGMEKQKPYRCEYCGKRYKNLNGLKYHRSHTTHGGRPDEPGNGMIYNAH